MAQFQQLAASIFFLGLATGITVLALAAYVSVSPAWLRWLLLASGVGVAGRYVTTSLCAIGLASCPFWLLRFGGFASWVGLTLPGVVALDQLVRHPAITPKKLLRWYAPFSVAVGLALGFGPSTLTSDPFVGPRLTLTGWALGVLVCAQSAFLLVLLGLSTVLIGKLRSWPIRLALAVLMMAYLALSVEGVLAILWHQSVSPLLVSEILTLLAICFAIETARHHTL